MSELPSAEHQIPSCGACGSETYFDGDCFVCESCQLAFDPETLDASFVAEDVPVCGAACDNFWHGDHKIKPGVGFHCGACLLPSGHRSMHWTGCRQVVVA